MEKQIHKFTLRKVERNDKNTKVFMDNDYTFRIWNSKIGRKYSTSKYRYVVECESLQHISDDMVSRVCKLMSIALCMDNYKRNGSVDMTLEDMQGVSHISIDTEFRDGNLHLMRR